jgi:hypothetical protein
MPIAKRPQKRAINPDDLARILEISDREGAKVAKTKAAVAAGWDTAAGYGQPSKQNAPFLSFNTGVTFCPSASWKISRADGPRRFDLALASQWHTLPLG